MNSLDQQAINTIRFLSVDQVEAANSGHPGLPLGAAPMAYALFDRCMRYNPKNPKWFNRDRFILSAGHGSALLYSVLHLYGFDLSIDDLKNFRQWESKTPGHPEYGHTPGVEATTGPLGQGFGMGVGLAIAEAYLAGTFNPPNREAAPIIDHFTYAIVSDGDLMEGVAAESASLAGHLKLGRLIYLYDDNRITIDGSTDLAFTENVTERFESYGWHVQSLEDGNDVDTIVAAVENAKAERFKPSLIRVRTHIGYGSPKQDSAKAHGEPLGADALAATRDKLGWPQEPRFFVPDEVKPHFEKALDRGQQFEDIWEESFGQYRDRYPDLAVQLERIIRGKLPDDWEANLPVFEAGDKKIATRAASGKVINSLAKALPTLIGGSADLAPSNKTYQDDADVFTAENPSGRNIHFGVREHAMGAALNGMALHGGMHPYGGTFLIFSDYMRPSIRLSALMDVPSIFVFTHDSVGLGEDGPTHQPIEQVASLRAIPNLTVMRPADANETAEAWRFAIEHDGPVALALTRQGLPVLDVNRYPVVQGVARGGYILEDADATAAAVIIASGSEVALAMDARRALSDRGVDVRVVSMPSTDLFDRQDEAYRREVLPAGVPTVAVEAGSPMGWYKYVGQDGAIIAIDRFGASAPGGLVLDKYGFNTANVVEHVLAALQDK